MPYTIEFEFADGGASVTNVEELSFGKDLIEMKGELMFHTIAGGTSGLFLDATDGCYVVDPVKVEHCEVQWK